MMKFFIDGVEVNPPKGNPGVYEITIPKKIIKMKKKLKLNNISIITVINDRLDKN